MLKRILICGVLLSSIPFMVLKAEETGSADGRCGLGGIVPGAPWPGVQSTSLYTSGSPKIFKAPQGTKALRLKENRGGFEQFVYVQDAKIYAVSREYDGEQETKVLGALRARYGQPANPGVAIGSMGMVSGKVQSRTVWLDPSCGTRVEFIRQESGMFKGKFAKSVTVAVLVTLADKKAPGDSPNPLD
jgi:hypothetical protein